MIHTIVNINEIIESAIPLQSSANSAFLTVFLTVLSAVIVLLIHEWIKSRWIVPNSEYNKLKNKIEIALTFYSGRYTTPCNMKNASNPLYQGWKDGMNEFRMLASESRACSSIMKNKNKQQILIEVHHLLLGISNGMFYLEDSVEDSVNEKKDNKDFAQQIRDLLNFQDLYVASSMNTVKDKVK